MVGGILLRKCRAKDSCARHNGQIKCARCQRGDRNFQGREAGALLSRDSKALAPEVLAGRDAVGRHVGHGAENICRHERRGDGVEDSIDIVSPGRQQLGFDTLSDGPTRGVIRAANAGKHAASFRGRAGYPFKRHLRHIQNGEVLCLRAKKVSRRNAGFCRISAYEVRLADRRGGGIHQTPDDAALAPVRTCEKANPDDDNVVRCNWSHRCVTVDVSPCGLVRFQDQV